MSEYCLSIALVDSGILLQARRRKLACKICSKNIKRRIIHVSKNFCVITVLSTSVNIKKLNMLLLLLLLPVSRLPWPPPPPPLLPHTFCLRQASVFCGFLLILLLVCAQPVLAMIEDPVLNLWERFFEDESTKDLTIMAKDGETLRVHSAFFSTMSDVFRAMLSHQMLSRQKDQV